MEKDEVKKKREIKEREERKNRNVKIENGEKTEMLSVLYFFLSVAHGGACDGAFGY